jgi:histone H3/H4
MEGKQSDAVIKRNFTLNILKKLVQDDDEVGRVSKTVLTKLDQVTGNLLKDLILASAKQTEARKSKTVTVADIQAAVAQNPKFDAFVGIGPTRKTEEQKAPASTTLNNEEGADNNTNNNATTTATASVVDLPVD